MAVSENGVGLVAVKLRQKVEACRDIAAVAGIVD
jgi:hypothetical protein